MVPRSTGARRLGGQDLEQEEQGGGDNSHIFAGEVHFFDNLRCPSSTKHATDTKYLSSTQYAVIPNGVTAPKLADARPALPSNQLHRVNLLTT
jgi:hypothetical protein